MLLVLIRNITRECAKLPLQEPLGISFAHRPIDGRMERAAEVRALCLPAEGVSDEVELA